MFVVKIKALLSCKVTGQLICAFVFAYAKSKFFHEVAHFAKVKSRFLLKQLTYLQVFTIVQSHSFMNHSV